MAAAALRNLPSYTRAEAELVNWAVAALPAYTEWEAWLGSLFGSILETPAGFEIQLIQTHCLEDQPPRQHPVGKGELLIGRSTDCDIVLPAPSVGKRHARLHFEEDVCHLEDLGSTLGTFVDQRKLRPGESRRLLPGEALTIFPYRLELRVERRWQPERHVRLSRSGVKTATWRQFRDATPEGFASCVLAFHPDLGYAHFEIAEPLLDGIVSRALAGAGIESGQPAPMDWGVAEFLFLSLLESASQALAFPLQVAPDFRLGEPDLHPHERGLAVACSLELTALRGGIRLFLPLSLVRAMKQTASGALPRFQLPGQIAWRLPVSAGFTELAAEEIARLESGDILIFSSSHELLFPGDFERGWKAAEEQVGAAPLTLRIGPYFERSLSMDSSEAAATPLGRLPLRLHVVLGEKECTLAELTGLAPGTLIQLDRDASQPVRLAVNGRIVGEGELVEIEGKLGVKILSWSGA